MSATTRITRFADIRTFPQARYTTDVDLSDLKDKIDRYVSLGLQLQPDFQRGHVWTDEQCSRFMEFFIRGGESGRTIIFNHPGWMRSFEGDFVLVDGLQRLTAALRFLNDEIPIFGSRLSEFEDKVPMSDKLFHFSIGTLKTREDVLQWYIDLNSGGTPHADAEIERVRGLLKTDGGA